MCLSKESNPRFELDTPAFNVKHSPFQDRAMKAENRLSATTTLTVNVMDSDDLDPAFEHELYNAKVTDSFIFTKLDRFENRKTNFRFIFISKTFIFVS